MQALKITDGRIRRIPTTDSMELQTMGLGATPTTDGLTLTPSAADRRALLIKGFASQTANLFEVQNSVSTPFFTVEAGGNSLVEKAIRLAEIATPTSAANKGFLYTKDDSGDTELYYLDDAGAEVQLTSDGSLHIASSRQLNVTAVQTGTTYNAALGELVRTDPSTNAITVNLPAIAAANSGKLIHVKIASGTAGGAPSNNVTVTPGGSDTVDGQASFTISKNRDSYVFVSDGTSDWVISPRQT